MTEKQTIESVDERLVNFTRCVLALSALIIIYIDPSEPDRLVNITYTTLALYTGYDPSKPGSQGRCAFHEPAFLSRIATIPPGTITVTTPYTPANPLNLGTVNLNPALTGYLGSAPFQHINVFDTRSGAQAWTLTAIAGDMSDGAGHFINGQNLGLTNLLPETANVLPNRNNNAGLGTITATDNAVPALPVLAGVAGTAGLGGAQHTVLHATQGPSDAWYSGTLTLFAPTTTRSPIVTRSSQTTLPPVMPKPSPI